MTNAGLPPPGRDWKGTGVGNRPSQDWLGCDPAALTVTARTAPRAVAVTRATSACPVVCSSRCFRCAGRRRAGCRGGFRSANGRLRCSNGLRHRFATGVTLCARRLGFVGLWLRLGSRDRHGKRRYDLLFDLRDCGRRKAAYQEIENGDMKEHDQRDHPWIGFSPDLGVASDLLVHF